VVWVFGDALLIIKKAPLVTWKAFLVLWALFLGFMGLVIKLIEFVVQFSDGPVSMNTQRSSDDGFSSDSLSAQQRHNMDSNGMSRSEVIRHPHW
jgi:hypothetical protein